MGKAIRLRGECQKNIVKLLDGLCGRYSRWEVWQDFIIMSAISIANVLGGPHREAREREYMEHASRYSRKELEVFAQMLAEVAMEMEREPDQDLLGEPTSAAVLATTSTSRRRCCSWPRTSTSWPG